MFRELYKADNLIISPAPPVLESLAEKMREEADKAENNNGKYLPLFLNKLSALPIYKTASAAAVVILIAAGFTMLPFLLNNNKLIEDKTTDILSSEFDISEKDAEIGKYSEETSAAVTMFAEKSDAAADISSTDVQPFIIPDDAGADLILYGEYDGEHEYFDEASETEEINDIGNENNHADGEMGNIAPFMFNDDTEGTNNINNDNNDDNSANEIKVFDTEARIKKSSDISDVSENSENNEIFFDYELPEYSETLPSQEYIVPERTQSQTTTQKKSETVITTEKEKPITTAVPQTEEKIPAVTVPPASNGQSDNGVQDNEEAVEGDVEEEDFEYYDEYDGEEAARGEDTDTEEKTTETKPKHALEIFSGFTKWPEKEYWENINIPGKEPVYQPTENDDEDDEDDFNPQKIPTLITFDNFAGAFLLENHSAVKVEYSTGKNSQAVKNLKEKSVQPFFSLLMSCLGKRFSEKGNNSDYYVTFSVVTDSRFIYFKINSADYMEITLSDFSGSYFLELKKGTYNKLWNFVDTLK